MPWRPSVGHGVARGLPRNGFRRRWESISYKGISHFSYRTLRHACRGYRMGFGSFVASSTAWAGGLRIPLALAGLLNNERRQATLASSSCALRTRVGYDGETRPFTRADQLHNPLVPLRQERRLSQWLPEHTWDREIVRWPIRAGEAGLSYY